MISTETKNEIFTANLKVLEEAAKEITQTIQDAKTALAKPNDQERNFNEFVGALMALSHRLEQIKDAQRVMLSIHRS